jgi:pyrroline-5-carboxylate reductase
MIEGTILLVGCGNMGGAMLKGWFAHGLNPVDVMVVEPAGRDSVAAAQEHHALCVLGEAKELPSDFTPDVIVFAVKPQVSAAVIPAYARFADSGTVFLSVIAGLKIEKLQSYLGKDVAVVRAMPNTPAAVGQAISVLCASDAAGPSHKRVSKVLMGAVGETAWIEDEREMDAVTAVSGSGPAYVFLLAEALAEAGVEAGLDPKLADHLARSTIAGAGALMKADQTPAATLRENVTSPGGTTAAALEILMGADGVKALVGRAVEAAAKRSRDLAD